MSETQTVDFLSVTAVAKRWNISRMTVYRLIDTGELKASRFGTLFRIHVTDVENYETAAVVVPEQEARHEA